VRNILIRRKDRGVSIMRMIPQSLCAADGQTFAIDRVNIDGDGCTLVLRDAQPLVISQEQFELGLAPEGVAFVYPDVDSELAKWSFDQRNAVVSWRKIPPAGIPADRTFRDAWCDATPAAQVDIDMVRAREIHRNHLRALRAPKMAALDIDYQRADETGDVARKRDVAQRKQAMRDATDDPAIEAAQTPEELKAVIPAALTS